MISQCDETVRGMRLMPTRSMGLLYRSQRSRYGVPRWRGPAERRARGAGDGGNGSASEGTWKQGLSGVAAPDPSVGRDLLLRRPRWHSLQEASRSRLPKWHHKLNWIERALGLGVGAFFRRELAGRVRRSCRSIPWIRPSDTLPKRCIRTRCGWAGAVGALRLPWVATALRVSAAHGPFYTRRASRVLRACMTRASGSGSTSRQRGSVGRRFLPPPWTRAGSEFLAH